ncbi:50S ribosomal protein L7ae-like protein [Clostridium niameyense]|uniref:50S ribosomal protein L7ae-like protein n=1 Tax=Clostridium niameyense TaxID=1622073 RepID=A0A6M0RAB5_9CLOT|nr:ribosomal L7Ae/L30e/S12e/Gadd45 family protein [Clostridium niameyense]NEZ46610.1 50S ribosomal protein L7ae-like protein [Clostridium niameyense]
MIDRLKGNKVVGIKQTIKAIKNGTAKVVYIANDASYDLMAPLRKLADENSLEVIEIDSMKELGKMCSIDVGAAIAALLKD